MMAAALAFLAALLLAVAAIINLTLGIVAAGVLEAAGSVAYFTLGLAVILRGRR